MLPRFDATITLGSMILLVSMVGTVVAAYYALLRNFDMRFASISETFTQRFNDVGIQLTKILDGDVREIRGRLVVLESGQSEWIKTVRDRTHQLANEQQALIIRVDRLERPTAGKPH